jgi:hypothetical protein
MSDPLDVLKLQEQRTAVRRARRQGRHWYLRAVLMLVVAFWGFYRGGGMFTTIGVTMSVLALLSAHLGRQMRRGAVEMERKLDLMEKVRIG